jgi:tetratricopeptide (TPR) repeat protein
MINKSAILISLVMCFSLTACAMSQSGALYQAQKSYQEADYEMCLTKLSQAEGYGEYSESVSSEISFYRGLCLERAGRKSEAVAVYQNLIRKYPQSNGAAQAQGRIRNLTVISTPSTESGTNEALNSRTAPSARTMLLLKVHVDYRHTSLPGSGNVPKDSAYDADVVLSKRYVTVGATDHGTILDFEKRRRIVVEKKTGTYVDYSLYDSIGFRVLELNNRRQMNQMLINAKIDKQIAEREDYEHELSVQIQPPLAISLNREGDETVFWAVGKSLFRQSLKGIPVDVEDSTAFAQFLRYNFGGHPFILDNVAKGKLIPSRATFTFRNLVAVNSLTITVTSAQTVDDGPYNLQPYAPRMLTQSQDGLDEILDRAWNMPVLRMDEEKERLRKEIAVAFGEARSFDAFLGALEMSLTTGEQLSEYSQDEKTKIQSDAAVQKLLLALKPATKEQLQEAVKTLQELRQHTRSKQHILKIFEANHRKALGETLTAQRLFTEVLQSHPLLTGAYKDLGDALLIGYDAPRAWRCWDIGRRITPQFWTFSSVAQFEKKLEAEHPEYF